MSKKCIVCGSEMDITIRTVFYNKQVKIHNVPVFSCDSCNNNELMEKGKLTRIINRYGTFELESELSFDKFSELAQLIVMGYNEQNAFSMNDVIQHEVMELVKSFFVEESIDEKRLSEIIREKISRFVH